MVSKKITSIVLAYIILAASVLNAQARPDTRYMSCAQAKSIIQSNGAVVFSTNTNTYAKYVKNHAYCNLNESLKNAYVPTIDNRRCKIGFSCVDKLRYLD